MPTLHHRDKSPGMLPSQGRCCGSVIDQRLKVKARRQVRRRIREEIRAWLGEAPTDLDD
jgi:hypothetical protein